MKVLEEVLVVAFAVHIELDFAAAVAGVRVVVEPVAVVFELAVLAVVAVEMVVVLIVRGIAHFVAVAASAELVVGRRPLVALAARLVSAAVLAVVV